MKRLAFAVAALVVLFGGATLRAGESSTSSMPVEPAWMQLQHPVVLANDLPDIAECHQILSQEIIDLVRAAKEDPAETYEKRRQERPNMMEAPPTIDCASKLWQALNHIGGPNGAASVPPETAAFSLRPSAPESELFVQSLAATVGANVDPANGVEAYQGEMQIAVNPNNPLQMVAGANSFYRDPSPACISPTGGSAATFGTQALYGSNDGGATWTYRCAPWPSSITGGVTGATAWFGSDPAMAWDAQGRAYAVYMLISQTTSGSASGASIVIARSSDSGSSWTNLGTIVNNIANAASFDDKEMVAIDNSSGPPSAKSHPGRIYVIWDENNVERVAYSDNGSSWTTVLLPATGFGNYDIGGNVVVGPDGTVYVIWNRLIYPSTQTGERIVFSKSVDGGATWTTPAIIASPTLLSFGANNKPPAQESRGLNSFGAIAIDSNPASAYYGFLYVGYPSFPTGVTTGTDINAYCITSTNGGTSWSTPVKMNDDSGTATQFFPWLAVDPTDGSVNASWYDTRVDPTNNRRAQLFYSRSSNGGLSFEPNLLVTDNGGVVWRNLINYSDENTTDNSARNANQYGDYSGIVAMNRQVHPFWTDTRQYFPSADTVSPSRREDAGSSTIVNCSSPAAIAAPSVNSCVTPGSVVVSWTAINAWGTNATAGTYSLYRSLGNTFPGGAPLASGLTTTSFVDASGVPGAMYFYFVTATNNCPGTALTPMTSTSPASQPVIFGSCGAVFGGLQGTVTAGGTPIAGVLVAAGSVTATTDNSGFYNIPALAAGNYNVTAGKTGYDAANANVTIASGAVTTQNFVLAPATSSACLTDTTQGDFGAGVATNLAVTSDLKLNSSGGEAADQISVPASLFSAGSITSTAWLAQTFRAGTTGNLTKVSFAFGLASGSSGTLVVELRNTVAGAPGTAILASTIIGPITNVGTAAQYVSTFTTPAAVTSGTTYAVVLRPNAGNTAFGVRGNTSSLANGQLFTSANAGSTWTGQVTDLYFTDFITTPITFVPSGTFVSSVKDSNSVAGGTTAWSALSWTAATPGGTTVRLQAAASNSAAGPFNFVGPDGTAATFFTVSGSSLAQFNGSRYLKYKALLDTSNGAATPTLSDVTVCYTDQPKVPTSIAVAPATGTYGGTVTLTATLTSSATPVSGKSITFMLNGSTFSGNTVATNASGVATIANVSLAGITASTYPTGIAATFAGDSFYSGTSGSNTLTVNKATPVITWSNPAAITYGTPLSSTQLNATANVPGSFVYTPPSGALLNAGNGQTLHVDFTPSDTTDYNTASKDVLINVNPKPVTVTADDKTKQFSDPVPAFTATIVGVLPGDSLSGVLAFSTTATTMSPAGTYAIVPSGLSGSNYAVTFLPGTLTVTTEDATMIYTGDTLTTATGNGNPQATVNLSAAVSEAQDGFLGNALGGKSVKFSIYKSANSTLSSPDYTATATIAGANNIASTTISLPEDDYIVRLDLVANAYYSAPVELAGTTVVTPEPGQASGGGWLTDANGYRATFTFTMKYLPSGKPQGNSHFLYRDSLDLSAYGAPAGLRDYDVMIRSTAMSALALNTGATPTTAMFTGKDNILAIDRITGASYNIGAGLGTQFEVDVTDNGEGNGSTPDSYALRVWNSTGTYKAVGTYTASGQNTGQVSIGGGNIRVK